MKALLAILLLVLLCTGAGLLLFRSGGAEPKWSDPLQAYEDGDGAAVRGQHTLAAQAFRSAAAGLEDPQLRRDAWIRQGVAEVLSGDADAARGTFASLETAFPEGFVVRAQALAVQALLDERLFADAKAVVEGAQARHPDHERSWQVLHETIAAHVGAADPDQLRELGYVSTEAGGAPASTLEALGYGVESTNASAGVTPPHGGS